MDEQFCRKLKMARRMRGLSMDELVQLMGGAISKQSISKYERGLMVPRPQHMSLLIRALRITDEYFKRRVAELSNVNYRCKGFISASYTEEVECYVNEIVSRYLDIEGVLNIYPEFRNPLGRVKARTYADVEKAAMLLRDKWCLGMHPIPSVTNLLETFGVMIVEHDIDKTEVLGLSANVNKKRPVIVVSTRSNNTAERKRFTMLHELAHILLFQKKPSGVLEASEERLCERFAGTVLCPPSVLIKELGERRKTYALDELVSIRERYGISVAAIVHCCKDVGIISEQYYNHLYDNYINRNKMEEGWGKYPILERTDRFKLLVQRAVAEGILIDDDIEHAENRSYIKDKVIMS